MSTPSNLVEDELYQLKQNYYAHLQQDLTQLDELWSSIVQAPHNAAHIHNVIHLAHKIAGTSGTFGFLEFSKTASSIEQMVDEHINDIAPVSQAITTCLMQLKTLYPTLMADQTECSSQAPSPDLVDSNKPSNTPLFTTAYKVLVVEDDHDIARKIALDLQQLGLKPLLACDTMAGTKLAINEKPDLIILDINMPCGDGFMLAERIIKIPALATTPIIFLTASQKAQDRLRAQSLGCREFLIKPYNAVELTRSLSACLTSQTICM